MIQNGFYLFRTSMEDSGNNGKKVFSALFPQKEVEGAPPARVFSDHPRTIWPLVVNSPSVEFGVEEIPVGSEVPPHKHANQEEILFVFKGKEVSKQGKETEYNNALECWIYIYMDRDN